jgi:hypothetical protein
VKAYLAQPIAQQMSNKNLCLWKSLFRSYTTKSEKLKQRVKHSVHQKKKWA